jgi:imidazolonepropionase-like amidohydrolase
MNVRTALVRGSMACFVSCLLAISLLAQQPAPPSASSGKIVEQGSFRLHKFEQAIGEETYTVRQAGDSLVLDSNFKFKDRFTEVPLTATIELAQDLTPQSLELKGKSSRLSAIDDSVTVENDAVHIREGQTTREEVKPAQYFLIAGYAPTAAQMMLMRYWLEHGKPAVLTTFPAGEVRIEDRGSDAVEINGAKVPLERYSVAGLIWGRETLWLDGQKQLAAVVTVDAEFDHFEAVREGFESALSTLIARAGSDEMAVLAKLAQHIAGRRTGTLAFVGATLIDGTGTPPIADSAVVVQGDRILAAGPRRKVKIPKNATVVDVRGKTILPGLWDMHAHFEQVEWGPIYLAAGVTTVRDCGNEFEFITAVRDAIRDGRGLGPRILAAGIVDGDGPAAIGIQRVNNAEEARQWVDRYHDAGFQQMKIYSSMKEPNVAAVTAEAHRLGMTVTGHIPEGMTLYQGIDAGMDQVNHIQYVADIMVPPTPAGEKPERAKRLQAEANIDLSSPEAQRALAFIKDHHTGIDPTAALMEVVYTVSPSRPVASFEPGLNRIAPQLRQQFVGSDGLPPAMQETAQKLFQKYLAIIGALHHEGVTIVAGTDQTVPGFSLYREIELYVKAGFTPMEAIQAATLVPARVMGLDKMLGAVQAGKEADLIVLKANPLDSITNIRTVEGVVTGGTLYETTPLWESVGFQP